MMVKAPFTGVKAVKDVLYAGLLISFPAEQRFCRIQYFLFPYIAFFQFSSSFARKIKQIRLR